MAYIYESDVGRLGGNLQTTVAYLLSLHKAEYEWNLLGIKVVGHVDALPIPNGTYEYGDAYTVGTAAPYDMWIYTRADAFHSEAYWFNIGKFPAPGPQGPKGDGWGTAQLLQEGLTTKLTYDSTNGGKNESISSMTYLDSKTGQRLTQSFQMVSRLPIIPGKYVSMDATEDNKKLKVKLDDIQLALDYFKIDKSPQASPSAPVYLPQTGTTSPMYVSPDVIKTSIASRDSKGDCSFHKLSFEYIDFIDGGSEIDYFSIYSNTVGSDYGIDKTPTDTGTLTNNQLAVLQQTNQSKNIRIVYDNQVYYRMNPQGAPDGTLYYIHIDSLQDGSGNYKATGKCFSVTVSTRAWQVVDLDFGRSYTHNVIIENSSTGDFVHFTLINHHPDSYAENADGLLASIEDAKINCTVTDGARYYAGIIYQDGSYFHFEYGDSNHVQATTSQVTITDTVF